MNRITLGGDFHITINSIYDLDKGLWPDVQMVKAALLYGDRATLCSPNASIAFQINELDTLPLERRMELLREIYRIYKLRGKGDAISYSGLFEAGDIVR